MIKERLRVLVVGNGGREHALAWKLSQSKYVDAIFVVPGNGGSANGADKIVNIPDVKVDDYPSMVSLAKKHGINLVVPGPETPLVDGIQGFFQTGEHPFSFVRLPVLVADL
jgi:phosphoribosylamine--glycine ligase/phosphoribosylformylglycinamidine cyclo-ligase